MSAKEEVVDFDALCDDVLCDAKHLLSLGFDREKVVRDVFAEHYTSFIASGKYNPEYYVRCLVNRVHLEREDRRAKRKAN